MSFSSYDLFQTEKGCVCMEFLLVQPMSEITSLVWFVSELLISLKYCYLLHDSTSNSQLMFNRIKQVITLINENQLNME